MYLVTGCSEPESVSTIKKKFNTKNVIFSKPVENVLSPSRPVDGVNKTSSLLGKPVDLAGLMCA